MREILEVSVPLTESPRQLHQARELARMSASRVVDAPRRQADAKCEQYDITYPAKGELSVFGEHDARLTATEPIEYQPSADDGIEQAVAEEECGVEPDSAEMPEDDQQAVQSGDQ